MRNQLNSAGEEDTAIILVCNQHFPQPCGIGDNFECFAEDAFLGLELVFVKPGFDVFLPYVLDGMTLASLSF